MNTLLFFTSYENNKNNWKMRMKKIVRSAEFQNNEGKEDYYVTNALLRISSVTNIYALFLLHI